ncbi:MAG TPA: aminopeptidase P N-terminal domain-containing protein [Candidatus Eisenbacteria bacterium]|nr:aminopeptidase P N-terminal domain-containing protein [Candidatus Eisenbacteria bacterium]
MIERKQEGPARPGDVAELFAERRRTILERLPGAALVLTSAPEQVRSNDTHFRYRQDNDFYYLTGFPEPRSVAVLTPERTEAPYHLFVRPRDPERETWDGRRAGVEGAARDYRAGATYAIDEWAAKLPALLETVDVLYFNLGRNPETDRLVLDMVARLKASRARRGTGPVEIRDANAFLADFRLRKSAAEIDRLRRACLITGEGHEAAMRGTRAGMFEYEIEAVLDYHFRTHGAMGPGYDHIVAGGRNATILHYTENRDRLAEGDLLLIDAGCEYDYYCADVTRTFPVGAAFTKEQRAIYDIVLAAQKAAIAEVKPGRPFEAAHEASLKTLVEGLIRIGVLSGSVEERVADNAYKPFFMHRTGHWLGMDVHDVGLYVEDGRSRRLEPGMVLTVEPGLYFGEWCGPVDERWKGIGVRIEDDVAVTETGCEVLSGNCVKEPDEIEALRAQALGKATVAAAR